jgi:ABC-type multidrug transport system fused ATPase/permease subunit
MSAAATTESMSRHGVPFDRLRAHMRRTALVAGLGLLLMAILAALATFAVLERLVSPGDAAGTTSAILDAWAIFWLAIIALFGVAVLDVVVAWALWMFFDQVHHVVAVIAAGCRALYALIFSVGISHLASAAQLLSGQRINGSVEIEVLAEVQLFDDIWRFGLALFGCHLLLIGWLAFTSGLVPRLIGVLVAIAGLGYLFDSLASLLFTWYAFELASFTFIGEVLLMIWLLIFAFRGERGDHPGHLLTAQMRVRNSGSGSRS